MSKCTVLLVEDDDTEEMLARRAIDRAEIDCNVLVARDGAEACRILFDSDDPQPFVVLLDLHLPKLNGFEVLERIRGREDTKHIPVVILSTSDEERDVTRSFDLRANSYMRKDLDHETYESRLKLLLYYWMTVNHRMDRSTLRAF